MTNILDTPLDPADDPYGHEFGGARTIREFFGNCMIMLWEEQDGFNGKRPYGNSGWATGLIFAVAKDRNLPGRKGEPLIDEDGYFNSIDPKAEEAVEAELHAALVEWAHGS